MRLSMDGYLDLEVKWERSVKGGCFAKLFGGTYVLL